MGKCCPTSDFNRDEIDPGKCNRARCTCLEAQNEIERLKDRLYQKDLKIDQLCECVDALNREVTS